MTLLPLKLVLVPALVAGVTLAGRRWGLRVGGLLTALPMVAGPSLGFYAIEQGDVFASGAASTTLLGIGATAAFCVAYAHAAKISGWPSSVLIGWAAFAAAAALMYEVQLGGLRALALTAASLLVARRLLPASATGLGPSRPPAWDIPMRVAVAAALVVLLTSLAGRLGPRISGLLAAFPVVTVIVAAFTHAQRGHRAIASYFSGLLRGLHSFAVYCFVFGAALVPLGLLTAVVLALTAQLLLQAAILWGMSSGSPTPAPAR